MSFSKSRSIILKWCNQQCVQVYLRRRQASFYASPYKKVKQYPLQHTNSQGRSFRGPWPFCLMFGAGILFGTSTSSPLKLETDDTEYIEPDVIQRRYSPPTPPYTINEANEMLRWTEDSKLVGKGSGVLRFDSIRLPSNEPCEDEMFAASEVDHDGLLWMMWGVFDGHAGWETAEALRECLDRYIIREGGIISSTGGLSDVAPHDIDRVIKNAFLSLDSDIMSLAAKAATGPSFLSDAMSQLAPAYSGSCALLSYYHVESQTLKVACTGDSRAVIGRRNGTGIWESTDLSVDQTGDNPDEVARLQQEHPGEAEMVKDGHLLNLAVTRAFGDSRWKWPQEVQEQAYRRFYGPRIIEPLLTPPYLTAEPVITTTRIEPDKGDFMIMASDGLWDYLTSQQAVDLIGKWLEHHDTSKGVEPPNLAKAPSSTGQRKISARTNPNATLAYPNLPAADERHFIVTDENAATHLARNALGGGNEDRLCGMLTPDPPNSRNLRDDITIQVIFFGRDDYSIPDFEA